MDPDRSARLRFEHRHLAEHGRLGVEVRPERADKIERADRTNRARRKLITTRAPYEGHYVADVALVTCRLERQLTRMKPRKVLKLDPRARRMRHFEPVVNHRLPHQPMRDEIKMMAGGGGLPRALGKKRPLRPSHDFIN